MRANLLIDHEDVQTSEYLAIRDPGRLTEQIGEVAQGDVENVDRAVKSAHQAFLKWRNSDISDRRKLLLRVAQHLKEHAGELARTVSSENGMPLKVTRAEVGLAVAAIHNLTDLIQGYFEKKEAEDETGWIRVQKKPKGVIASIVPWNAPVVLTVQKLTPALLCGNTIVFKPSPYASICVTYLLKQIASFFPPGVINVVHGGAEVGAALTQHPLIRKISFTGGGPTAKHIMRSAADSLKDVHFELGGNDPAEILNDIDLDEAMPKIVSGVFRRSGQFCFAIKRIYIPRSLYEQFYESMCAAVDELTIGYQLDENAVLGPMNNEQQFRHVAGLMERIQNSPADMVRLGKKIEPDNWENGYYLQPAVVRNVQPEAEIVACEQFGPVIPLIAYETEEEAIKLANRTEYGLASSVWSADFERALRVAEQIEAGLTFINNNGQTPLGYRELPFGGVKQSGIGRENTTVVFDEYIDYHGINLHKS